MSRRQERFLRRKIELILSMSDEPTTAAPDVSPGAGYQVFVDMNNLQNKLKLLNYDDDYVSKWRMKPISRIHFAVTTNPGDQLHAFIALAAWLFQKAGIQFDRPNEVISTNKSINSSSSSSSRMMIKVFFCKTSSLNSRNSSVLILVSRLNSSLSF